MVKINTDAFNQVSKTANLTHDKKNDSNEVRRNTSVYDIPMTWINAIRKNNISVSSYLKQALYEKLKRDEML